MNLQRDLDRRLLSLFPVRLLKDYFQSDSVSDTLYRDILNNNVSNLIKDFAVVNLDNTKQHIYIFSLGHNPNLNNINLDNFPFQIENETYLNDSRDIIITPTISFDVILSNPFEQVELEFKQPFKISITNNHLIFYATILEKKLASHIVDNRSVIKSDKINSENTVIQRICEYFGNFMPFQCDLNRGVKYLWHNDILDSKYAKWKKDRSTTTETMDENFTLKSQYPEIYQNLTRSPLKKTIFKYLIDDEEFPDHFTVDPGVGQISIPLYPKNENQNRNVVNAIISNNR